MRRGLLLTVLAAGLLAAPAWAADEKQESPAELLDEAARKMMRALELMVEAIPQYALPEINENGDIIIRRIHPEDEAEEAPKAAPSLEPGTTET